MKCPPSSDGGAWTQLQEQIRIKVQSKQMTKVGKSDKPKTAVGIVILNDKTKSIERSGMAIDQAGQVDKLLSQSA